MKYTPELGDARCPECGHVQKVAGWPAISKKDNPEAVESLLQGKLFEHTCEKCGYFDVLTYTCVYVDKDANVAIVYGRTLENEKEVFEEALPFVLEELDFDTAIIRWVTHVDELSAKARIFDCGLDDRAVEVAKLMALRWLAGKDELHELSMAFFSGLLEDGDLLLDIVAVSDTANEQIAFFRDKYDGIVSAMKDGQTTNRDFVVDQRWAENYLAETAVQEAAEAMSDENI